MRKSRIAVTATLFTLASGLALSFQNCSAGQVQQNDLASAALAPSSTAIISYERPGVAAAADDLEVGKTTQNTDSLRFSLIRKGTGSQEQILALTTSYCKTLVKPDSSKSIIESGDVSDPAVVVMDFAVEGKKSSLDSDLINYTEIKFDCARLVLLNPAVYDYDAYMFFNPDLKAMDMSKSDARAHWLSKGAEEGRNANYNFRFGEYKMLSQTARQLGRSNSKLVYIDYIKRGIPNGTPGMAVASADVFNIHDYMTLNPDVVAKFAGDEAAIKQHWLSLGWFEKRQGHSNFNCLKYLERYPDVELSVGKMNCLGAIGHYVYYGKTEGRSGKP